MNPGQTIAEKILSRKVGRTVYAGELIVTEVDGVMATDTTGPYAIKAFEEMGGGPVWDPGKCALIIDHAAPAPNERIADLHRLMRDFAKEKGIRLFEIGEGICHQVMVEEGYVKPGDVFMGADSHTPTYGALGALACGVGSTDLAAVMKTGKIWLKVPESILIRCSGKLQAGVSAKDVILHLVGQLTISGATYQSVEFAGETFNTMTLDSRMTIANMVAEMGGKTGFVDTTGLDLGYDYSPTFPDRNAVYTRVFDFDLSDLQPQISVPESPDRVENISGCEGRKIDYAFIGTCCNGRLEDLRAAARILRGRKVAPGVRLLIGPASRSVLLDAITDGTLQTLVASGATILNPGCGPCVGTHQGVPGKDEVVISAANRNFRGRMGNPNSSIYLAAPGTVAASAVEGRIVNPKKYL